MNKTNKTVHLSGISPGKREQAWVARILQGRSCIEDCLRLQGQFLGFVGKSLEDSAL